MSWHTSINGDVGLIFNGPIVVGSIEQGTRGGIGLTKPEEKYWRVQVLWSGPGGDIEGEFSELSRALCFIEGVEKTLDRMIRRIEAELAEDE